MRRIIDILKEFQYSQEFVSLSYFLKKFSISFRTLQKDIQRINSFFSEISNCKIIKNQDKLIIIGDEKNVVIDKLIKRFTKLSTSNRFAKLWKLILYFIWENQPLINHRLIEFSNDSLYNLKQDINLINNLFYFYNLNLRIQFRANKGWVLDGQEKDLRFFVTSNLINQLKNPDYPDSNLPSSFWYIHNQLKVILLNNYTFHQFFNEIIYFLVIMIKRVKNNKVLEKDYCSSFVKELINNNKTINHHSKKLINALEQEFGLKFNQYEVLYLKTLMLLNQKNIDSQLVINAINDFKIYVKDLIFNKYQLLISNEKNVSALTNFLEENYLKLVFNYYYSYNVNLIAKDYLDNDCYLYGWEAVNIISCALKNYNINIEFSLFVNNYFLKMFNNFYLQNNQPNWIIPLYYQQISKFYYETNEIILFIKNNYPNIILKPLNISNSFYDLNFLNKNYTILIHNTENLDFLTYKKIYPISYNNLFSSSKFQQTLDFAIKMTIINQISASILVFDFFFNQKFYNLASFLDFFQNILIKRFKLNSFNFELRHAFIYHNFSQTKILLIHKLLSIDNIKLPIILVYLKNPLFFHKKTPIHFIFIIINNAQNLYQFQSIISYFDMIKNNFKTQIKNAQNLYQIINNSL